MPSLWSAVVASEGVIAAPLPFGRLENPTANKDLADRGLVGAGVHLTIRRDERLRGILKACRAVNQEVMGENKRVGSAPSERFADLP